MFSVWEIGKICSLLVHTPLSFFLFQQVVFQSIHAGSTRPLPRFPWLLLKWWDCLLELYLIGLVVRIYVINSKFVTSPRSFTKPRTGRTRTGQKPANIPVFRVAFYGETTAYGRTYYFLPLSRRNANVFRPSLSSVIIWIHSLLSLSPFFSDIPRI